MNPGSKFNIAYLVMFELHPREQILGNGEDVPQHVDLELIECLVDIGFKKCLQLVQSILDLKFRLWIDNVSILISLMNDSSVTVVGKPQSLWGSVNETRFEAGDRLVDQVVDRVDNVVYKGLVQLVSVLFSLSRGGGSPCT